MKVWISVTLGAALFLALGALGARAQMSGPVLMAPSADDEAGIKADIDSLLKGFNAKDSEAWAAAFDPDGTQNSLRGLNNASGHDMIAANYKRLLATSLAKAQNTLALRSIHMVSPTVAVVDGDCIGGVGNDHDLWEFVMDKKNGQWFIWSFHEYAIGEK